MKKFDNFLAISSILGFLAIALQTFIGIDINPWVTGILFIIIGSGLVTIGQLFNLIQFLEDGLTNPEIAFILTGIVGLLSIIAGISSLPISKLNMLQTPAFDGVRGVVALFAMILIAIQTWMVK